MAGAGVVNEKNHCDHCLELRRSLVKTLGEKRLLLLRLQKEQGRIRKLLREGEKARRRDNEEQSNSRDLSRSNSESGGEHCLEQQLNEVIEVNKKWKEDYDALKLQYETKNGSLQKELDMTKEKLATAETQVLALGSEVSRLATTVNQMYQREGSSVSSMLDEVFKQQIQVYKEDFSIERRDRERAQSEKDCLQQKLKDAQDIIATLTQEVELYKEQLDETLEKSRRLRSYSDPPQLHNSCPQLQIIYPVNRPPSPSQRQWRQEQRRQGILTRGANHYTAPPSFFYGGEVEVDDRRT
ncbi:TNFAIP3-interacting protein 3-like [Montipora capricornis]|uniref:TNFAIP3-interacting protein 3-like n=1 Tax=Montipora foliosa TaxID=591990 RepID=UPI0035F1F656